MRLPWLCFTHVVEAELRCVGLSVNEDREVGEDAELPVLIVVERSEPGDDLILNSLLQGWSGEGDRAKVKRVHIAIGREVRGALEDHLCGREARCQQVCHEPTVPPRGN